MASSVNERERQEIESVRAELERLRREQAQAAHTIERLSARLQRLEERATAASTALPPDSPVAKPAVPPPLPKSLTEQKPKPPPIIEPPAPAPSAPSAPPPLQPPTEKPPPKPEESWEIRFGTVWLPRIGIVMVLTALVFLAYYIHGKLPTSVKVIGMYLLCGAGVGLGSWIERKYETLSRVLFAGGLAGVYFVTFALHYVPALKMIDSPLVCGVLLLCIVAVIVGLAQWKNRPWLAGLAILLGFYTSALSDVATFTLVSNCILATGALYVMLTSGWAPLTGMTLLGTYGTYLIWLIRSSEATSARVKIWFVLLYWALYTLAVFAARRDVVAATARNLFATVNNLLAFVFLTQAILARGYGDEHWKLSLWFGAGLVGLALLSRRQFQDTEGTFATYLISGLGLLTLALVEKFSGYQEIAALATEGALLVVLGHLIRQPILRWFGAASQLLCVAFILLNYNGNDPNERSIQIATWFAVSLGFVIALVQHWQTRPDKGPLRENENERVFVVVLALAAIVGLLTATFDFAPSRWRVAALALEALGLLVVGGFFRQPIFHSSSVALQFIAVALLARDYFRSDSAAGSTECAAWFTVGAGYVLALIEHRWSRKEARAPTS